MRLVRVLTILAVAGSVVLSAQTSPLTAEQRAQFHGPYSQPEEPFRLVGNIAGHATNGVDPDMQVRVIEYWRQVDGDLGARVAKAIESAS